MGSGMGAAPAVVGDGGKISLDEFLDDTNAVEKEVRACCGDDGEVGDNLLSTQQSLSSFSKTDIAEENVRGSSAKVDGNAYNPVVYSLVDGAPGKESSQWEYDLDRENSNAAALLLCHTSTPKLSLHPRGLRSVGGPVSFATASQQSDAKKAGQHTDESGTEKKDPEDDVSLTWKLMETADKVVQFFSSLHPIQENRRFGGHPGRQTLPNPKRLQPNEIFARRQQDQLKQAAMCLRDAVTKLVQASGTTNAEMATMRLPGEIRSRFVRLRLRLVQALQGSTQMAIAHNADSNAAASNLDRFASLCNYLAQVNTNDIDSDVRQEFITFSQRHAQDLESHCRTFRWLDEERRREGGNSGLARGPGLARDPQSFSLTREPAGMGYKREVAAPIGYSAMRETSSVGLVREPSAGMGAVREHYIKPRVPMQSFGNQ
jgi:hypothetical protein